MRHCPLTVAQWHSALQQNMRTWCLLMLRCAAAVCSRWLYPALCLLGAGLLQLPAAQVNVNKAALSCMALTLVQLVMLEAAAAVSPAAVSPAAVPRHSDMYMHTAQMPPRTREAERLKLPACKSHKALVAGSVHMSRSLVGSMAVCATCCKHCGLQTWLLTAAPPCSKVWSSCPLRPYRSPPSPIKHLKLVTAAPQCSKIWCPSSRLSLAS